MRVIARGDAWCVQYGFWRRRGSNKRFMAYREWSAPTLDQAYQIAAKKQIELALDPVPTDAEPMVEPHAVTRAIREAPADPSELLRQALEGLPDPLPSIEESHAAMRAELPAQHKGGRQFYCYFANPVYQRLAAMAANAKTTRNRILEALVLCAGEGQ